MDVSGVRTLAIRIREGGRHADTKRLYGFCVLRGYRVHCVGGVGAGRAARSARRQANNSLADGRPNAELCDDKHGSGNRSGSDVCAAHASGNRIELCLGSWQAAYWRSSPWLTRPSPTGGAGAARTQMWRRRSGLRRAQEYLAQRTDELRRIAADAPLPTVAEGQLNVARSELSASRAALEKLTIRASIDASALQVNARPGELISPSTATPLILLGDISALRVRAELDERDIEKINPGQPVLVRPAALPGREVAGTVSFIAPLVEAGRYSALGQRNMTDVDVVEALIELSEPGPLVVGMKVDVYFRQDSASR